MSILQNINYLRQLRMLGDIDGFGAGQPPESADTLLTEEFGFGANPGGLRMFSFVPPQLPKASALVVVLHGCTQTAASHDLAAGWSHLAERYGFALLMPQQTMANNSRGCFNWFQPGDVTRDSGEAASIRHMIAEMLARHSIDKRKIFITGLSAGGAMTAAMLAVYPDVFAAGAIVAGLPYGVAGNVQQALAAMSSSRPNLSHELGDLVRAASTHRGPWPRISIWHGSADRIVNPLNADELVKQWCDVHGIDPATTSTSMVDGHPHQVWWDSDGKTMVESYTITDMAHGTPLGSDSVDEYGSPGQYAIEAGISSSYHIASFFGLTHHKPETVSAEGIRQSGLGAGRAVVPRAGSPRLVSPAAFAKAAPKALPSATGRAGGPKSGARQLDIGAIIDNALKAAGLKK